MILKLEHVKKEYISRHTRTEALSGVDFSAEQGEFVAVMGESGSGKTTLLNIAATLDRPTDGTVWIDGKNVNLLKEKELAAFRRDKLGFVFQEFQLLDQFNNRDNIFLPLVLSKYSVSKMEERLGEIADALGIRALLDKYPYEISGGQKQRIAIARAVITKPQLLLADEPTGALDSASTEAILRIFTQLHEKGQTILMVTHSLRAAAYAGRVIFIKDGIVYHEIYRGSDESNPSFMERIGSAWQILSRREAEA